MPASHEHRACALRHRHAAGGAATDFVLPGASKHYPPDLELDPVHLDVDASVDLVDRALAGTVTLTVEARRDGPTDLTLHAVMLEDVHVEDPDGRPLTWQYDGREIQVVWQSPFSAGESRRVAVSYKALQPASGLYFSSPSEAYPSEGWFAATDHETERARHWLPCVDLANARPRLDLHLRAETRFTILANGALVGDVDHGDGTHTAHWKLDYPCPSYLLCFAIGDFVRADDGTHAGLPIAYFTTPRFEAADLVRAFGRTGEMLDWMTRKLGMAFPFPKYFQFALQGFGGAMENISLVSWDDSFVLDNVLAMEWTRLVDEINVHEMAHSYFGDAVVCRDQAHSWLKESWAVYIEQMWFEDHGWNGNAPADERNYQFWSDSRAYFEEADNDYKRPIVTREFNSSWQLYDRHLYPGGACRLHTLRAELGDATFWAGVRAYLARYAGRVVETDDFRRVMEEVSGRSLVQFFEQWLYSPGYPQIKVAFKYDAKRQVGTFEIEQTQADADAGIPLFVLRTDVGWTIDGTHHTLPIKLTEAKHVVMVPMAKAPDMVRFDPGCKVLHKLNFNPGDARLRTQLTQAPDVMGRVLAAFELAATGTRKNLQAIREAYAGERFWGAKVQFALALAKAAPGAESAIQALAEILELEEDPMVLPTLMQQAAKLRDPRLRQAVEARLDRGLPYYRSLGFAYEALGAQREDAPLARLTAAAAQDGFGGHAQSGAFRGLGATRSAEAIPVLMEATRHGRSSNLARPAAVSALGSLGKIQEKGVREQILARLVDLLRDPNRRVRNVAVFALQTMGAGEAIPALEAFKAPLSRQEQVTVDEAIAAIRAASKPAATALETQLEELRGKVRKLADQVQKLEARAGLPEESNAGQPDGSNAGPQEESSGGQRETSSGPLPGAPSAAPHEESALGQADTSSTRPTEDLASNMPEVSEDEDATG